MLRINTQKHRMKQYLLIQVDTLSLISASEKVIEQVLETTTNQMKEVVVKSQYGFTKGKSYLTNLIIF